MAMVMINDISPASSQISAGKSPVVSLLSGTGAILVLIAFALIILAWSCFKECTMKGQENNRSEHHNVMELGGGGKNMSKVANEKDDLRVIVIMAGDDKPTFIAQPTSVAHAID